MQLAEKLVGAVKLVNHRVHGSATHLAVDPADPAHICTREDALRRLKDQSVNHYSGIYNVMKGATLAAAGLAMVAILVDHLPVGRVPLLLVGFLAVIISYNGAAIGQTIVHLHASAVDVVLPMALTIAELVVVTLPGFDKSTQAIPSDWVLALGIWQIMAGLVILSIVVRLDDALYQEQLLPALHSYRERQLVDWKYATGGGVGAIVFWFLSAVAFPDWSGWSYVSYVLLTVITILFIGAIAHHGETRRELVTTLLRPPGGPAAEDTTPR